MLPPLFNPSNDLALAANVGNYTPPRNIRRMEADLRSIARFWDEGPWGWSLNTRQRYLKMGVSPHELPDKAWLEHHRNLSSRATACDYIRRLLHADDWHGRLVGQEMTMHTTSPDHASSPVILKSPWSSSGKGILVAQDGTITPDMEARILRILRTQGSILSDRFYGDKAVDFAMEFFVHPEGEVQFLGYSVFQTDDSGQYGGQLVAGQAEQLQRIGADEGLLRSLVAYHQAHLPLLGYTGPLGIDMMRLADRRLHPVVEINLRRNMGILALTLYERGLTAPQALTPPSSGGFQMVIDRGMLRILRSG